MNRLLNLILKNPLGILQMIYFWFITLSYRLVGYKTVVYNLHHDYFYAILEPVYERLRRRKDIVVFFSYRYDNLKLQQELKNRVGSGRILSNLISPFVPFHLFICPEITGPDFPASIFKTTTIEVYHGNGIAGFHEKKGVLNRFDVHFAIGPKFNQFLEFAYRGEGRKPRVYNTGYPKLDILLQTDPLTDYLRIYYKLDQRPTLLYAPHWNPYGSLHVFDLGLIEAMCDFEVNLLVKPHHYLYSKYREAEWQKKLESFAQSCSKMTLVQRPNTQELYPLADIMISDTGTSAPFEFSLLQKPLLVFHNEEWFQNEENPEEERIINQTALRFTNIDGLKNLLTDIFSASEEMTRRLEIQKSEQQKMISDLLYNPGHATEKSYEAILKELGLND